jgi:hypothetical protein
LTKELDHVVKDTSRVLYREQEEAQKMDRRGGSFPNC